MKKIIYGDFEKYKVEVGYFGWSYAAPCVYVRRKLPIIPVYFWRYVWRGKSIPSLSADKMLPEEMQEWFFNAVKEYENYKEKWREAGVNV